MLIFVGDSSKNIPSVLTDWGDSSGCSSCMRCMFDQGSLVPEIRKGERWSFELGILTVYFCVIEVAVPRTGHACDSRGQYL